MRTFLAILLLALIVSSCQDRPPKKVMVDLGSLTWTYEVPHTWLEDPHHPEGAWHHEGKKKLVVRRHGRPVQKELQELLVDCMKALKAEPVDPSGWPDFQQRASQIVARSPGAFLDRAKIVEKILAEPWSEDTDKREEVYRSLRDMREKNLHDSTPGLHQRVEEILESSSPSQLEEVVLSHVHGVQTQREDGSWSLFLPFGDDILEYQLWGAKEEFEELKSSMTAPLPEKDSEEDESH